MQVELSGVWTLFAALVTIELGKRLNRALPWIERASIPPAVTAGLLISLVLAVLRAGGWLDVKFATAPRDATARRRRRAAASSASASARCRSGSR
jgi:ESS family glutamate:Na+ symporter